MYKISLVDEVYKKLKEMENTKANMLCTLIENKLTAASNISDTSIYKLDIGSYVVTFKLLDEISEDIFDRKTKKKEIVLLSLNKIVLKKR